MSKRHKAEVAFAALVDEYNSLYEQNAKLVEALQKYGRHQNNPKHMCEKIKHSDHPCTCGWDDLLKENCQHLNRELVNMSDVMCTDCGEMVNHGIAECEACPELRGCEEYLGNEYCNERRNQND